VFYTVFSLYALGKIRVGTLYNPGFAGLFSPDEKGRKRQEIKAGRRTCSSYLQ
jgi:hypothetical protein